MAEDACSSTNSEEIKEIACAMAEDLSYLDCPDQNPDDKTHSYKIHRIHQLIHQIDRFAYEPSVLAIGPYHHSKATLQYMEKLKWRCLDYILNLNCTKSMRDYLLAISNLEIQARAYYSSEIKLDSKGFQRMLLLDGCFILVYLRGTDGVSRVTREAPGPSTIPNDNDNGTGYTQQVMTRYVENSGKHNLDTLCETDQEIGDGGKISSAVQASTSCSDSAVPWYHNFTLVDLFLLENQIPFFVVRKLFWVLVGSENNSITESMSNYIEENLQYFIGAFGPFEKPNDFCHLLHLCHMHFKPRMMQQEARHLQPQFTQCLIDNLSRLFTRGRHGHEEWNSSQNQKFTFLQGGHVTCWRRATHYHEAGIVFKRKEFDGRHTQSLLDVTFLDGELEIPCIFVDDRTGSLFRNMIAFEQTNPRFGNCITAYFIFMSQLISRPDDVTLLSERGIIVHNLHSDKVVSSLFTRLTKGVVFDFMGNFYLRSICCRMEMYYQSRMNRWIAWLSHNHLSNPWLGLALLTGLLVLVCTIAQTVLTVLAYMEPP